MPVVEEAVETLVSEGVDPHVVDLRTLVPLDEVGLVQAVEKTGRCVVVHEAPAVCGFGAEVISLLQEQAFYSLEAPVRRVTAPDVPYPMPAIEHFYVPDSSMVVRAVKETLSQA